MTSPTNFLHKSTRRSDMSEHARRHSGMSTTLYWHDSSLRSSTHGCWAPSRRATPDSSSANMPHSGICFKLTASSPIEETRRSRLASRSITGLNSLWTTVRSKSNDPPSTRHKRQRPHSTSSVDVTSLDGRYCPRSNFQARCQSSHSKVEPQPDLSAFVPEYLDEPPPYSSPVKDSHEIIDWAAHFDSTPLLTRTVSPHTSPAIQEVRSPATPVGGVWDRVASRVSG